MTLIWWGFGILAAGLLLEGVTSWFAIRVAKKHYPDLWCHSGNPTLLGNGDLINAWPLVKYYRDRSYLQTAEYDDEQIPAIVDKKTIKFAEKLRVPLVATYFLAWKSAAVAFALFIVHKIIN